MGKKKRKTSRIALLLIATGFILFGLWFSSTNAFKFLSGYMLYQVGKPSAASVAVEKMPVVEKSQEPKRVLYSARPKQGDYMGDLEIPKINATLPIYHGTNDDELDKGVGHYSGSVLPGENDNSVLSGHRDTIFRKLGEVGKGDLLIVSTSAGTFTYKVRKVRIVDADDRTVIVPKPRATLTITTCYPFDFIGSAPERYVLVASLVNSEM